MKNRTQPLVQIHGTRTQLTVTLLVLLTEAVVVLVVALLFWPVR